MILPCKDILCEHCFLDLQEEAKLACPKCGKGIPKEFDGGMTKGKMRYCILTCKAFIINPFQTNGIFHKATYNKGRMVHFIYLGATGYNFQKQMYFFLRR